MAGSGIQLELTGMDAVAKRLEEIMALAGGAERLLANIGEEVVTQIHGYFKAGAGPDGEAWLPSKRVERDGGQTLVDTARLKNSFGYQADESGVEIGTNVIYDAIHNFGGADVGMPEIVARPHIPTDAAQIHGLALMVDEFIGQALQ